MYVLTFQIKDHVEKNQHYHYKIIINVYKPAGSNFDSLLDKLNHTFETYHVNLAQSVLYILGDLSINLLKYTDSSSIENCINTMFSHKLCLLIHWSTRVTSTSHSVIDCVWTNGNKLSCSGIIPNYNTVYCPLFFTCNLSALTNDSTYSLVSYRIFVMKKTFYYKTEYDHLDQVYDWRKCWKTLTFSVKTLLKNFMLPSQKKP